MKDLAAPGNGHAVGDEQVPRYAHTAPPQTRLLGKIDETSKMSEVRTTAIMTMLRSVDVKVFPVECDFVMIGCQSKGHLVQSEVGINGRTKNITWLGVAHEIRTFAGSQLGIVAVYSRRVCAAYLPD